MGDLRLLWEWPHALQGPYMAAHERLLACWGSQGLRLWNLNTGEPEGDPQTGPIVHLSRLQWLGSERLLALGNQIWEWNRALGSFQQLLASDPPSKHCPSQPNSFEYECDTSGSLWVGIDVKPSWYFLRLIRDGQELLFLQHPLKLESSSLEPGGRFLAVAGQGIYGPARWCIWDLQLRRIVHETFAKDSTFRVSFSPDGSTLVVLHFSHSRGELLFIETEGWQERARQPIDELPDLFVWSPNSHWLATARGRPPWKEWDGGYYAVWDRLGQIRAHGGHGYSVAFSPDSQRLANLGFHGQLSVIDLTSGKSLGHVKASHQATAHQYGNPLLFAGQDRVVTTGADSGIDPTRIRVWHIP